MKWSRLSLGAALGTVALLVLAACGGGAEPTATSAPAAPTATPRPTATAAPTATTVPGQPTATPRPTATPAPQPTAARAPEGALNIAVIGLGPEIWLKKMTTGVEDQFTSLWGDSPMRNDDVTRVLVGHWLTEWTYQKAGADNVWSFKMRPGVLFNEGEGTASAEDVKFNIAEAYAPGARTSTAFLKVLVGDDINNFETVGPLEFKLHGPEFDPGALNWFGSGSWQPKAYTLRVGDEGFNAHPIGSGPFIFKSAQKGSKYTAEAVPNHWFRTAKVKTVSLLVVPEAATRLAMLKTGQVDLAPLPTAFKPELTGNLRSHFVEAQSVAFVAFGGQYYDLPDKNCGACPWNGNSANAIKVREAMSLAIDRQAVLNRILYGNGGLVAVGPYWGPGPYPHVDAKWQALPYDPTKAKQLLAEAGYAGGFEMEMAILSLGGLPELADISEAVAGYWEAIGIKIKRSPMEWSPVWRDKMRGRTTGRSAWVLYAGGGGWDPEAVSRSMRSFWSTQGLNVYSHDPFIDQWLKTAPQEQNLQRRVELAKEMGQYFYEKRLNIPLFSINGLWGVASRIASWSNQAGQQYLNNVETITLR